MGAWGGGIPEWTTMPIMEFCDKDTTVGLWKTGNNNIPEIFLFMSIWIFFFQESDRPRLNGCWTTARKEKAGFNLWQHKFMEHPLGKQRDEQKREALENLIFTKNLTILFKGSQPTFITCRATSTINITMATGEKIYFGSGESVQTTSPRITG